MASREPELLGGATEGGDTDDESGSSSDALTGPAEVDAEVSADPKAGGPAEARSDAPAPNPEPEAAASRPAPAPPAPLDAFKGARARRASRSEPPTFHVAGFWRRFASGLIDAAVILPVSLLLCWIAGAVADVHLPASRHRSIDFWLDLFLASDPALMGILGLTAAIALVYLFVFQLTLGRTLGMRALKIRIIDVYGDAPSTVRAVVRTAGYLAGLATLGLGFLWVGFDAEKRGLHDWISSTYVVKA